LSGDAVDVPLAVVADGANTTADGKLNVLGAFNTIFTIGFPSVHPRCVLVVRFAPAPDDIGETRHLTIRFGDVDGGPTIWELQSDLAVAADPGPGVTFDNILGLVGLPIPHEGEYAFEVIVDGEQKASIAVFARQLPQPEAEK
jgi:hypothetical protein